MKISKAMLDDLVSRGATAGPSVAEILARATIESLASKSQTVATFVDTVAGKSVSGIWTFRVPNWSPTPVNKLYDHHWASRRKHKNTDAELVAYYGRGVPKASQKRAVGLHVVFPPGKRMPDVDAYAKSLLDALVQCGILVNDSSAWCVLQPVGYSRGQELVSFITVEDI